ncbi:MAG: cytochrome b N-terminal domain-containing protein, partial [Gammaproteobacteria bacterium]
RFFAFHVIALPLILLALVLVHLLALHEVGSNNPDGIEIKEKRDVNGVPLDGIPFHPYYTIKDMVAAVGFLIIFLAIVFYAPEFGGWFIEADNFVPADPLQTPEHIKPLWYFTPFYAILRAVPHPLGGFLAMGAAVFLFFLLPWLDRSPVKSIRYRGWIYRVALGTFAVSFLALGYLGTQIPTPTSAFLSRFFSVLYFSFFLLMPIYSKIDRARPVPDRVTYK